LTLKFAEARALADSRLGIEYRHLKLRLRAASRYGFIRRRKVTHGA
jgi:hypothetical protein